MELLIIVIIAFLIGKAFGGRKNRQDDDWPDEPVQYEPPKKKKGCFARLISLLFKLFVTFILFAFIVSLPDDETAPVTTPTEIAPPPSVSSAVDATAAPAVVPTVAPTSAPTAVPTTEPATLQDWAKYVAQAEYGSFDSPYTDLISVECVQADGESAPMIIINVKYPDTFLRNNDERMSGFLFNVMNTNWKFAELAKEGKIEYGSVFIHGRTMFLDKYGNEIEGDAAQIRIKASEAAKVNWSYSTVTGDMMPGIAVSFGIHPVIRDGLSPEYLSKIRK